MLIYRFNSLFVKITLFNLANSKINIFVKQKPSVICIFEYVNLIQ